jgi:hypothetical protein
MTPNSKINPKKAPKKKMTIVNRFRNVSEYNSSKKSIWDGWMKDDAFKI